MKLSVLAVIEAVLDLPNTPDAVGMRSIDKVSVLIPRVNELCSAAAETEGVKRLRDNILRNKNNIAV